MVGLGRLRLVSPDVEIAHASRQDIACVSLKGRTARRSPARGPPLRAPPADLIPQAKLADRTQLIRQALRCSPCVTWTLDGEASTLLASRTTSTQLPIGHGVADDHGCPALVGVSPERRAKPLRAGPVSERSWAIPHQKQASRSRASSAAMAVYPSTRSSPSTCGRVRSLRKPRLRHRPMTRCSPA